VTALNDGGESEPSDASSPIKAKPLKGRTVASKLTVPPLNVDTIKYNLAVFRCVYLSICDSSAQNQSHLFF